MNLKNSSHQEEAYFDQFDVRFHLSDQGMIFHQNNVLVRDIAKEWELKVTSCVYGENADGFGMHPLMKQFIALLESHYGDVQQNEIPGFVLTLEGKENGTRFNYFICAGNNGQEISTGLYLMDLSQLDDAAVKKQIQAIDAHMFQLLKEAGVSKLIEV